MESVIDEGKSKAKRLLAAVGGAACGYLVLRIFVCPLFRLRVMCEPLAVIVGIPIGGVLAVALLGHKQQSGVAREGGVAGALLRSITPGSAALTTGYAVVIPILASVAYEFNYGRPSSTAGLAIPVSVIMGLIAAAIGASLGWWVRQRVSRSRWAGPLNVGPTVALALVGIAIPTALSVHATIRMERASLPRVIASTNDIVRVEGGPTASPVTPATFVWQRYGDHSTGRLRWNGQPVEVAISEQDELSVVAGSVREWVPIAAFDYPREAYAVTATLQGGDAESLALLIYLRSTGRRNLLLIFDPSGRLIHQELLAVKGGPRGGLAVAGSPSHRQEIVVNFGMPLRYRAPE